MFLFSKQHRRKKLFRTLIKPHVSFLYAMALRYTGNKYDAEDMVQETVFIALKKMDQLRDKTKSRSWLFSILRRVFLKETRGQDQQRKFAALKKQEYLSRLESFEKPDDVAIQFEKKSDARLIQTIVEALPERYKSPVLLYFMEDLTYKEISIYLDIPMGTVMSRLSRAKTMIKNQILTALKENEPIRNIVLLKDYKKAGDL